MDATELITLSFTVACTLGPILGFSLAFGYFLVQSLAGRGFAITFGKRPSRSDYAAPADIEALKAEERRRQS